MKIDLSTIKKTIAEQSIKVSDAIITKIQNQDSLLNKIGYSILSFTILYNIFASIYGYSYFTYSLLSYISHFILILFFSFILGFYVLNNIFNTVILIIGEQIIKLFEFVFRRYK